MMCRPRAFAAVAAFLACWIPAAASSPGTADAVLARVRAADAAEPQNEFQQWVRDTLRRTAGECWAQREPPAPMPDALLKPAQRAGVFLSSSDSDLEEICSDLAAHGVRPACASGRFFGDATRPDPTLPPDYVQFDRQSSSPTIAAELACHLTGGLDAGPMQPYSAMATGRWLVAPSLRVLRTPAGVRELRAGTLEILVPGAGVNGKPFRAVVTAVVGR